MDIDTRTTGAMLDGADPVHEQEPKEPTPRAHQEMRDAIERWKTLELRVRRLSHEHARAHDEAYQQADASALGERGTCEHSRQAARLLDAAMGPRREELRLAEVEAEGAREWMLFLRNSGGRI